MQDHSENKSKNIIDNLNPKAAFKAGLLSGLAIMFVLGFFILLGMMISNKNIFKNDNDNTATNNTVADQSLAEYLSGVAKNLKIDTKKFDKCFASETYKKKVQEHSKQAQEAGGRGTPYSVILADDKKIPINGALPYETVKAQLDSLLNNETPSNNSPQIKIAAYDKEKDWVRGNKDAKINIIEFSDIDCPFCKRFHGTMQKIVADYDGQVNWIYRHFPLTQLHPDAAKKAEATECVGAIGGNDKFWTYLDTLIQS